MVVNFGKTPLADAFTKEIEFDNEKFEFAMNELPEVSKYSYLANNILHKNTNIDSKLIRMLIQKFPDGELNDQLSLILKTDYGF